MSIMSQRVLKTQAQHPTTAIPTIGVIRPGYKRLINAVAENPVASQIAQRAFNQEISFLEAEKLISKAVPSIKKAFYPCNTVHFNMHASDFVGGAAAVKKMLDLYGEQRQGDDHVKLYRFPIVFPDVGSADAALPVRFEMHVGLKYKSQDNTNGGRSCIFLPPIDSAQVKSQYANRIRQVQRREWAIRGPCEPEKCAEFAAGDCKLKGSLQFFIPGLTGLGVVKMPSGSSYALEKIWTQLDNLHKSIGRIPNFDNEGKPVFYLTKTQEERAYVDAKEGELKHGLQWVPVLEANIDSSVIVQIQDQQRQLALTASKPVLNTLPGPKAWKTESAPDVPVESVQSLDSDDVIMKGLETFPEDNRNAFKHFVEAKYGINLQIWTPELEGAESIKEALEFFNALTSIVEPGSVNNVLKLSEIAASHSWDMQTLVKPYLVKCFGKAAFKSAELSAKGVDEIHRLLDSGADAARTFMEG